MNRRMGRVCATAVFVCVMASCCLFPAWSYNKPTHMVSALIAYKVIAAEHPSTLTKINAILKQHPCSDHWLQGTSGDEKAKLIQMFACAASWPDDVKMRSGYYAAFADENHPEWHYIDIPYSPDKTPTPKLDPDNIEFAFAKEYGILSDKHASSKDRAVALCWIEHLIGDGHCPLHSISLYSKAYPKGDRGGNLFWIRVKKTSAPLKLHAMWDGLVIGSNKPKSIQNAASILYSKPTLTRKKLPELNKTTYTPLGFNKWVQADYALAKRLAYLNGCLNGCINADAAVALPSGYTVKAKSAAERQIVLAGYRIARTLIALDKAHKL